MSERFYAGQRDGEVIVREADGSRRPLRNRFDYRDYATERAAQRLSQSPHARLAFNLLADALENDQRADQVHEYFVRRVMPLLPPRFTISRSRLLAYVDLIDQEKNAKIGI